MNTVKKISLALIFGMLATSSLHAEAKKTYPADVVYKMQMCLAIIHFVDEKLADSPKSHPAKKVQQAREGLKTYSKFINEDVVDESMKVIVKNDAVMFAQYRENFNNKQKELIEKMRVQIPAGPVAPDHAQAVEACMTKVKPEGDELKTLNTGVEALKALASLK